MTDGRDLLKSFEENGLIIKDVYKFANVADKIDLNELVDKLSELERKSQETVDHLAFFDSISKNISGIRDIVAKDNYYRSAGAPYYEEAYKDLANSFDVLNSYRKAEDVMNNHKQNMYEAGNDIFKLSQDKSLDDVTRTSEALKLFNRKKACEAAYEEALDFYNAQKKLYEDTMKNSNIVDMKNDLLKKINRLESESNKIGIAPETRESLLSAIAATRDKIARFGLESLQCKKEFNDLCDKYGLGVTEKKIKNIELETAKEVDSSINVSVYENQNELESDKKIEVSVQDDMDNSDEVKVSNNIINEDAYKAQEEVENTKEIKDIFVLVSKLHELNPGVNISLDDGALSANCSYDKLVLPQGFKFEGGVLKNSVLEVPFTLREKDNVKELEQDMSNVLRTQEEVQAKPSLLDRVLPVKESRIKSGRHEVTRTQEAVIAPYGKSIISLGGVALVASTLATASVVPVVAITGITGALAAVGQKIYKKLALEGRVEIDAFKGSFYEEHPEDLMWYVAALEGISQGSKKLMGGFKQKRKEKKKALEEKRLQEEQMKKEAEAKEKAMEEPKPIEEQLPKEFRPFGSDVYENQDIEELSNLIDDTYKNGNQGFDLGASLSGIGGRK